MQQARAEAHGGIEFHPQLTYDHNAFNLLHVYSMCPGMCRRRELFPVTPTHHAIISV